MNTRAVSLAIIGAGPAGLAAAGQAARLGIDTVVLDLHTRSGGHYYNLPPADLRPHDPDRGFREGEALVDQAWRAGAEILTGAEVWGLYPEDPFRICLSGSESQEIRASMIILAPGAIERPWPVPGWTLPGVISAGGALTLLKNQRILPGQKILISGTGPLQLALAAELAKYEVEIAAVLELKSREALWGTRRSLITTSLPGGRIWDGLNYLARLWAKNIPYRLGWSIVEAIGEQEVRGAVIAQIAPDGNPIPGSEKAIDLDCICLGYGLLPETQFTRLLECDHVLHPELRTWIPVRDQWLQTSQRGVFAAGDAAGIGGKSAALLEGRIAAIGAAIQLDRIDEVQAIKISRQFRRALAHEARFAQLLQRIFSLPADPCTAAKSDTIICRCECITYAQVLQAIRDGATSVQAVKYYSRAGMGWCRGTTCGPLIGQIIAHQRGISLEHASQSTVRPPLFPVSLEDALDHEGFN